MNQDFHLASADCWAKSRRGNIQGALAEALQLKCAALDQAREEAVASASGTIAWLCLQAGEVEIGLEHAYAAKTFWATKDPSRAAWSGAVYAWLLLEAGLAEEATDEAMKALATAERSGDDVALSWSLNVLGVVFWGCKQLERAQAFCERAVELARSSGDLNLLSWWLINEAGIHADIGCRRTEEGAVVTEVSVRRALSINQEAMTLARTVGDDWSLRIALLNAAEYLVMLGELPAAASSIEAWTRVPGEACLREAGRFFYAKGLLLAKQRRFTEALEVYAEALVLARRSRNVDNEASVLRDLSQIYESLGQLGTALDYFKSYHEVEARLAAEKIQRRIRFAEIHYETDRLRQLARDAREQADAMAAALMLDPLTGIGNRRRLDEALAHLQASSTGYAVAVVDLDHFKSVNDTHSHMVGDKVLQRVAAVLQAAMRSGDVVTRMGGEEFVVVMEGIDIETATARCRALSTKVSRIDWTMISPGLHVTASIGVAAGAGGCDLASVMALADQRLYRAKEAGRNQVIGVAGGVHQSLRPEASSRGRIDAVPATRPRSAA